MVELVPDSSLGRVPEHYEGLCFPILAGYISRPPGFVRVLTPNHQSDCRLGTISGSFDTIHTIQLEAKGVISTQQRAGPLMLTWFE